MSRSIRTLLVLLLFALPAIAETKASHSKEKPVAHRNAGLQKKQPAKHSPQLRTGELKSGEAASLETKEAGFSREEHEGRVDNRGRLNSSHHAKKHVTKHGAQTTHKATHAKGAAKVNATRNAHSKPAPKRNAPELKAGNLTSGDASRVRMTEAAAVHAEGWSVQEGPAAAPETPEMQKPNTQNPPRLKKHNARMF